jgi:class 3 adenylate cyclase
MPLYIDIHRIKGATADDVAKAHLADVHKQHEHGVNCLKYWFNDSSGKIFCLIEAPSADAADRVHREAHGLLAEKIIEIDPDLVDTFFGNVAVDAQGAVVMPGGEGERDTAIRTVMFTDIVGSTELTQRVGDKEAFLVLKIHDQIVRRALTEAKGREIKHTGDGIMACFVNAPDAVLCAANIQRAFSRWDNNEHEVKVRIGAAVGEPVEHNQDLFGTTVQLAARLCARAEPEQILVTSDVYGLCGDHDLDFRELAPVSLKGFDTPIRVHTLQW